MRRLAALLAVLLTGSIPVVAASAAPTPRPSLTLVKSVPVTVSGHHFRSRERVRLVPSNGPAVYVRANAAGSFTVTLSQSFISRCGGFSLRATGTHGSVAALKQLPRPACMPV